MLKKSHAMPKNPRHVMRKKTMSCHAMPKIHAMPKKSMPCRAKIHAMPKKNHTMRSMPCQKKPCHAMPCHKNCMPCHALPKTPMPRHAMPKKKTMPCQKKIHAMPCQKKSAPYQKIHAMLKIHAMSKLHTKNWMNGDHRCPKIGHICDYENWTNGGGWILDTRCLPKSGANQFWTYNLTSNFDAPNRQNLMVLLGQKRGHF